MGHDISGYNKEGKEIAYLRYSAFYESNDTIYKALNCCEFYGGYSGLGEGRIFSKNELINALIYLSANDECVQIKKWGNDFFDNLDSNNDVNSINGKYEREKKFITDCLDNLNSNNEVYISFG